MGVSQVARNPRAYVIDKVQMYRAILFDPERFYSEWAGSRGISREFVLVALVGIVGAIGTWHAVDTLLEPFGQFADQSISDDVENAMYGHAAWPLISAFFLWFGFTMIVYVVSWLYSTVGSIYMLLKYTAWAMVPMLFAFGIRTIAYLAALREVGEDDIDTDLTQEGSLTDQQVQFLWEQAFADPIVLGGYLLTIPFAAWTAYIAAPGIAQIRDLDMGEAYRVVAVPVVLYAIYLVYVVATTL